MRCRRAESVLLTVYNIEMNNCTLCLHGELALDSGGLAVIYCRLRKNNYPISFFCNRFKKIKDAD